MMQELTTATQEIKLIINELANLYSQDVHGVFKGEATLILEKSSLRYALEPLDLIKNAEKSDKLSDTSSVKTRNSHCSSSSRASTSSSVIKMRAAGEAAAAKEQADYECLIAEREKEMKQREAEEEKHRQQAHAQCKRDVAIMSANKQLAIANAKLKAIQESIVEGELGDPPNFPDMDITECQERTVAWVNTSSPIRDNVTPPPSHPKHTPEDGHTPGDRHTPENRHTPKDGHTPRNGNTRQERTLP